MLFGIYIYNLPKMEGEGEKKEIGWWLWQKTKKERGMGGNKRGGGERKRKKGNLTSLDTHMANDLLLLVFIIYYLLVKYFLDPFGQKRKRKCSLTSFKMTTFYPRPLFRTHLLFRTYLLFSDCPWLPSLYIRTP